MFSLSLFSYRDVIVAVFNLSGKMSHSNDAFCLSVCVSFINYICSLTTKFGTSTTTYRKFSFKVVVIISTFSNKGVKNLRILLPNIFFKFNCAFVCVSFTATFFTYFISYPVYFKFFFYFYINLSFVTPFFFFIINF